MTTFNTAANFTALQGCAVLNDVVVPFGDNFNDNSISGYWLNKDSSLAEQNSRLEFKAALLDWAREGGIYQVPLTKGDGTGITFKYYENAAAAGVFGIILCLEPSSLITTVAADQPYLMIFHHGSQNEWRLVRDVNTVFKDNISTNNAINTERTVQLIWDGDDNIIFKVDGTELYNGAHGSSGISAATQLYVHVDPLDDTDAYYRYIDDLDFIGDKKFLVHDSGETDITAAENNVISPATMEWSVTGTATYTLRYKSSSDYGETYTEWSSAMSLADFRDTVDDATAFQIEITVVGNDDTSFNSLTISEVLAFTPPTSYDLFITIGQSNMEGHGNYLYSPSVHTQLGYEVTGSSIDDLADPFGGAQTGSCIPAFANQWFNDTGRGFIGIESARGGTPMIKEAYTGLPCWDVAYSDEMYDTASAALTAGLAYLAANTELTINSVNVLFCQGETDAENINGTTVTAALYEEKLIALIEQFNTDHNIDNFFIFQLGLRNDAAYTDEYEEIQNAQTRAAWRVSNAAIISERAQLYPSLGWMKDEQHYNQTGLNDLGTDGATNAAISLSADVTAPVVSAPVLAQRVEANGQVALVLSGVAGTDAGDGWNALTARLRFSDDSEKEIAADGSLQDVYTSIDPAELWQPNGSDVAGADYFDMVVSPEADEAYYQSATHVVVVGWDENTNIAVSIAIAIIEGVSDIEQPEAPEASLASVGADSITLDVTLNAAGNPAYAIFRQTDGSWSEPSDDFKVIANGELPITGLTGGKPYETAVVSGLSGVYSLPSDPVYATPTDGALSYTGVMSRPLDIFREMIAGCASFQSFVSVADAESAKQKIHIEAVNAAAETVSDENYNTYIISHRPFAVLYLGESLSGQVVATDNLMLPQGTLVLDLEANVPEAY
ncbi:MAG: hypothetical protein JXR97_16945, partial [Planctomycetes bacterium]|nr:hypothetical protein [Planctomycetota bacterium]